MASTNPRAGHGVAVDHARGSRRPQPARRGSSRGRAGSRHRPAERGAAARRTRRCQRSTVAAVSGPDPSSATTTSKSGSLCSESANSTASSASGHSYVATITLTVRHGKNGVASFVTSSPCRYFSSFHGDGGASGAQPVDERARAGSAACRRARSGSAGRGPPPRVDRGSSGAESTRGGSAVGSPPMCSGR